jgi:hypothetical protein
MRPTVGVAPQKAAVKKSLKRIGIPKPHPYSHIPLKGKHDNLMP